MSDNIQTARCYVHNGLPMDVRLLHEHHVHPRGYGGEDEPENCVWLCGSCHDLVHRLAHYIRGKKIGIVSDLAYQYQTSQNMSPAGRARLMTLAETVATAMESYIPEADEVFGEEEPTVMVQLALPRSIHKIAKSLASSHVNPKSGRPMGLYRYLEKVITNHCRIANQGTRYQNDPSKIYGEGLIEKDTTPQTPNPADVALYIK